jgi:hypothetical protein
VTRSLAPNLGKAVEPQQIIAQAGDLAVEPVAGEGAGGAAMAGRVFGGDEGRMQIKAQLVDDSGAVGISQQIEQAGLQHEHEVMVRGAARRCRRAQQLAEMADTGGGAAGDRGAGLVGRDGEQTAPRQVAQPALDDVGGRLQQRRRDALQEAAGGRRCDRARAAGPW